MQNKNSFLPYPGNVKLTIAVLSLWDENSPFTISFLKGEQIDNNSSGNILWYTGQCVFGD